ncbi:MAG TPA: radical SAM protein, partial [Phycisphaerae bacterium]|nr:radical SAM protein [Phycisphaerae bacterium]
MGQCCLCHRQSDHISGALGLCTACILADTPAARRQAAQAHARCRARYNLPPQPPRAKDGIRCDRCVNACRIGPNQVGYCGVRSNRQGRLAGGDAESAAVQWYYDPLPTNCVADWVCPASGPAGYPTFTDITGPERGFVNLAVFYEACSFDCLFCQNWHFRTHSIDGPRHSTAELAGAVTPHTRCICFFGGDPSCQIEHALAAARSARQKRAKDILRICWETNGSVSRGALTEAAELSLESGGCIKFDLKAWDDSVHRALCGVSNRRTLDNFEYLAAWIDRRPDPPFLIASTLLVPGYVDETQVGRIAEFVAGLNPTIPYALLAFHPAFQMQD